MGTSLINLIFESVAVYAHPQSPASSLAKPELRPPGSQSGDWELAQQLQTASRLSRLLNYTIREKSLIFFSSADKRPFISSILLYFSAMACCV